MENFETPLFQLELDRIGDELVKAFKEILAEEDKIATGKTEKSIRSEIVLTPATVSIFGAEGIYNIEKGREAFEVLLEDDDEDLLEWMDARSIPRSAVKNIAAAIYFNPLPAVPITGRVVAERLDAILQKSKLMESIATDAASFVRKALEIAYQNSKITQ